MKSNAPRSAWTLALVASFALAPVACNKSEGDGAAAASAAPSASAAPDAPLTLEQYEKLVLALSSCKAVESESSYFGSVDPKCPAYVAFNAARSKKGAMKLIAGKTGPLGRKLLDNPAPAVRVQAASMVESILGTSTENSKAVAALAKKEKDIAVLKALLHAVWNNGAKNPDIAAMLLSLAAHDNAHVRATAAVGISSPWNKRMAGGVEKLIQLIEKDPDAKVKEAACEYAGQLDDDRLIPVYAKNTAPNADPALAAGCFTGLLKMWASFPLFANANEKAYKLTLELLAHKPRTDKLPPWTAMSTFESVGKAHGSSFDKWKAQAKWYDPKAVKGAMFDLAADKNANWLGRAGAVRAAVALGATKAELATLKKKLPADDKQVASQIDKSMPDAK